MGGYQWVCPNCGAFHIYHTVCPSCGKGLGHLLGVARKSEARDAQGHTLLDVAGGFS